jgi:hypothetical protein
MIIIRFGRWNGGADSRFIYERIWWKGYKWTPFVRIRCRYAKSNGLIDTIKGVQPE